MDEVRLILPVAPRPNLRREGPTSARSGSCLAGGQGEGSGQRVVATRLRVRNRWSWSEREIPAGNPHGGGVQKTVNCGTGDHLVGYDLTPV